MRVIDHRKFKGSSKKPFYSRTKGVILILLTITIAAGFLFLQQRYSGKVATTPSQNQNDESTNQAVDADPIPESPPKLKIFSGPEFYALYHSFAYPNTQTITEQPEITGHPDADQHIRKLAEARGYVLRSVPISPIFKVEEPNLDNDNLLQEKALASWNQLKQLAAEENIPLKLNSAYRSVDLQRIIFKQHLTSRNIASSDIATGRADGTLNELMRTVAVPGHSRHHTGYTVDFVCGNGQTSFEYSPCFTWLSNNNYEKAKRTGWIPSYPPNTPNQGPDPEPWEYVWVGADLLYE